MAAKNQPSSAKELKAARKLRTLAGALTISEPDPNDFAPINDMGFLIDTHGDADVPDPDTDTLEADNLWLYNTGDLNEPVDPGTICGQGTPLSGFSGNGVLTDRGNGSYDWELPDSLTNVVGNNTQTNVNNNKLWVFAFFKRGDELLAQPASASVEYEGDSSRLQPPALAASKSTSVAKQLNSTLQVDGIQPCPCGRWLKYRDIPAKRPTHGHLLLDHQGNPLRASTIAVYAPDVDWSYAEHGQPHGRRRVRRPVGDSPSLSPKAGTTFSSPSTSTPGKYSPHNSIIIWQGNWTTRERTVVVAESRSQADVIELDNTQPIYVHVNYRQLDLVRGTFGLRVKVLRT